MTANPDPVEGARQFTVSLAAPTPGATVVEGLADDDESSRRRDAELASTYDPQHVQLNPSEQTPADHGVGEAIGAAVDVAIAVEVSSALEPSAHEIPPDPPAHAGGES